MEVSENARLARFDDMLEKSEEVAWAGASGVDQGRDAALAGSVRRIDPKRGAAPIDVGMKIDEARRDQSSADVADVSPFCRLDIFPDCRDAARSKGNVGCPVEVLRRIDNMAAFENEVMGHRVVPVAS